MVYGLGRRLHTLLSLWGGLGCLIGLLLLTWGAGAGHAEPLPRALPAFGDPRTAGAYEVRIASQPQVLPVGSADVLVQVMRAARAGEQGAGGRVAAAGLGVRVLARMPSMFMGEREEVARPEPGHPGVYRAPARFPMGGAYEITVIVVPPQGEPGNASKVRFAASTGQALVPSGVEWGRVIDMVRLLVLFLLTGGGIWALLRWGRAHVWSWLGLAVTALVCWAAVTWLRRPGAMTPIEAQVMDMNMPAPPSAQRVNLARVERGTVAQSVFATAQAVGFVEQDVVARTQGVVRDTQVYVGTRVRAGQVLAHLDTSQTAPALAAAQANALAGDLTARAATDESAMQQAAVKQAEAEVGSKQAEIDQARAGLEAAQTQVEDATAGLETAQAEQSAQAEEFGRSKTLFAEGAISAEDYQRSQAQNVAAQARVRQARARVSQAGSLVAAARSALHKAEVELRAHHAHRAQMAAALQASRRRAAAAGASAQAARAGFDAMAAQQDYTTLRAPSAGIVSERLVSPGTLVSPGQVLLRVVVCDPIRLQAQVSAEELVRLRVGARVYVEGLGVQARLSSVAPAVDPTTHIGLVEALLPNPGHKVVPGSSVGLRITARTLKNTLVLPSGALREEVQGASFPQVGPQPGPRRDGQTGRDTFLVWVVDPEGQGAEGKRQAQGTTLSGVSDVRGRVRAVAVERLADDGQHAAVAGELIPGSLVVTSGGNLLHEGDEVEGQGSETAGSVPSPGVASPSSASSAALSGARAEAVFRATIAVTAEGFAPATVTAPRGVPLRLTFVRRTDQTCTTAVRFARLHLERDLPLGREVVIDLPAQPGGPLLFSCPMNMNQGKVVVR